MTNPINDILRVGDQTIGADAFYEIRVENDALGNPLYVGYCPTPNGSTASRIWFIIKLYYDGNGFINRVQQPDDGASFTYAYDDRLTYFS